MILETSLRNPHSQNSDESSVAMLSSTAIIPCCSSTPLWPPAMPSSSNSIDASRSTSVLLGTLPASVLALVAVVAAAAAVTTGETTEACSGNIGTEILPDSPRNGCAGLVTSAPPAIGALTTRPADAASPPAVVAGLLSFNFPPAPPLSQPAPRAPELPSNGKLVLAFGPRSSRAARSNARAASSGVSNVPSHRRTLRAVSSISATHRPADRCRTPRYFTTRAGADAAPPCTAGRALDGDAAAALLGVWLPPTAVVRIDAGLAPSPVGWLWCAGKKPRGCCVALDDEGVSAWVAAAATAADAAARMGADVAVVAPPLKAGGAEAVEPSPRFAASHTSGFPESCTAARRTVEMQSSRTRRRPSTPAGPAVCSRLLAGKFKGTAD
eukprot:TRINITY_DN6260_c0_g1_i1.p2 TRINITY_DN6260_c0_g1~~TRINITY_DN6260_c0_g1_i1.p2  ORF type:complete len:383 (-),score=-32.68 TRINITY_DN6260_c0_g1_i1:979-2127(-)